MKHAPLAGIVTAMLILSACGGVSIEIVDKVPAETDAKVFHLPVTEGMMASEVVELWFSGELKPYISEPGLSESSRQDWLERIAKREDGFFFWRVRPELFGGDREVTVLIPFYRVSYIEGVVNLVEVSANRVLSRAE